MLYEVFWFLVGLGIGQEYPNLPSVRQASKMLFDNFEDYIKKIK
jgi:hypothetical protein